MTRDLLARLALHVYPRSVRSSRGEEMLATLLDACDGSSHAFAREMLGLLRGGLRARSRVVAAQGVRRLIADGACLAAMLWIADWLTRWVPIQFEPGDGTTPWQLSLLALALLVALIGWDRIAGTVGMAWIVTANPVSPIILNHFDALNFPQGASLFVTQDLAVFLLFSVMILAPRRRAVDVRRLAWLIPIAAVGLAGSLGAGPLILAVLATSAVGITLLAADPRLVIAAALWWSAIAMPTVLRALVIAHTAPDALTAAIALTGPAVLTATTVRIRRAERQTST